MAKPVISAENLSKRYFIGHQRKGYLTFRESLNTAFSGMSKRLLGRAPAGGDATREEFWALKNISFEIQRGDCVAIIGRNGAGKSTLLKLLSRIVEPTTGRIHLRGRMSSLLEVGTGFHAELTGRENIFLNGAILGMRQQEIKCKLDEIVAFAEIEKFLDTPVKHFSSGMYMRLAFAVAAHLDPEILIIDEVLAVGDASFQKKCLARMSQVAKNGRTVLFVSHNISAVKTLCQRGILLKQGTLEHAGDLNSCIERYQKSYSLQKTGAQASNLLYEADSTGGTARADEIAIEKIELLDEHGAHANSVSSWKELRLRFTYTIFHPHRNVHLGFELLDAYSQRLFALTTRQRTDNEDIGNASGVAECRIPSLPLAPGEYFLCVFAYVPLWRTLLHTENIAVINVTDSQMEISGRLPSAESSVIPEFSWTFKPSSPVL